jgi:acyl-coenzyme A thioesterase PaaI-like protein
MSEPSVQELYAPQGRCFGCGPANEKGLRIRSHRSPDDPKTLVCSFVPEPHHLAFEGVLNGGIIGALLDCHSNWTAAIHFMDERGLDRPSTTVTSEFNVTLKRPTPVDTELHLRARVVDTQGDRATVEAELEAGGKICATCRGVFIAVKPGHPAYDRW